MDCHPFNARISRITCEKNQDMGDRALKRIWAGHPVIGADEIGVNRMLGCGGCPHSTITRQAAQAALKHCLKPLAEVISAIKEDLGGDYETHGNGIHVIGDSG